jgi:tRNA(fMet)-specific endonuclease VapC
LILLDTNVLVHYLKGDPAIVARIQHASRGELAIPAIVVYELKYPTLGSKLPARCGCELETGGEHIEHVPFDSGGAMAAAGIRIEFEKQDAAIGPRQADSRNGR